MQTCLPEIGRTSEDFKKLSWWQKFLKFNPLSTVILLGWIVCLILALQWGGESGDWSEPRIVATLVVFAVTLVIWLVTQYLQGEDATVPWSIAKQRTVAGSILYSFVGGAAFTIVIYWLPIWCVVAKPLKRMSRLTRQVSNHQGRQRRAVGYSQSPAHHRTHRVFSRSRSIDDGDWLLFHFIDRRHSAHVRRSRSFDDLGERLERWLLVRHH